MATTNDEGFHEIQLNGKQLVFLFMAVTVVSVVIFLCGVLVGRGVQGTNAPVDPLIAENLLPADAVPAAASTPASGASATANEDLSYPDRLARAQPAAEQLREVPPVPHEETAPATSRSTPPAAAPAPAIPAAAGEPAGAGYAIQLTALSKRDEAESIAKRLTGKGYPAYVLSPETGAPAVFRVRVGKFKDRREAESVRARLQKEEQFNPWIVR